MMDLNFFEINKKQELDSISKKILLGSATALVIFIGGTLIYNGIAISKANGAIDELNAQINNSAFAQKYEEGMTVGRETSAYSNYNNTLNDIYVLISDRNKVEPYLLKEISYSIPKEVYLNTITVDGGNVVISARATNRVSIAEFQHNINDLDFISNSHISSIASDMADNEVFTFDITCGLKEEYYNEAK